MNARTIIVAVAAMLLAAGGAEAQTHAPWPTDWNNWSDPALWCTVGDPGNAADTRYATPGYGSVSYEYKIGKYEVTAGQYTAFLNAVGGVDTYALYNTEMPLTRYARCGIARSGGGIVGDPFTYSVAADYANRPVNCVSYWDACRFANWLSNGRPTGAQGAGTTETGAYTLDGYDGTDGRTIQRNYYNAKYAVPSEDEWYKAAYYKGGSTNAGYWDYPTSSNTDPGRDIADASGNNANYGTPGTTHEPIDSGKWITLAGEFQNSDSPYGTFDQGGNVWERNEAIVDQGSTYADRGLLGAGYTNGGPWTMGAWARNGMDPAIESDIFGFRVCEVPFLLPRPGDFNGDGFLTLADVNMLYAVLDTTVPPTDKKFDLAINSKVDFADAWDLVRNLCGTSMADTNLDHTVDILDLGNLANKYGQPGSFGDGDTDANGVIDIMDLGNLANDYGKSFPLPVGSGVVPEPITSALLIVGGAAAMLRRRRT